MNFETITSKDNAKIKQVRKLVNSAKEREKTGLFVVEGARLCLDAVLSGIEIQWLMFHRKAMEKYTEYLTRISQVAHQSFLLDDIVLDKISDTQSSQGVICVCKTKITDVSISNTGKYVAIENLSNPSNLGAIARTAEALGIDGLMVLGSGCDVTCEKALRASMGSLFRLPVWKLSYEQFAALKQDGMQIISSVVQVDATPITQAEFTKGAVMVIGNEGNGISDRLKAISNQLVTIPIKGKAESFNAAAAAAILLWEFCK